VGLADRVSELLGDALPVAIRAYDGSRAGQADAAATIVVRSPAVLGRLASAPGELGFARAYVAGDVDFEGDIFAVLDAEEHFADVRSSPRALLAATRAIGWRHLRPLPPPPEEARLRGRRHTRARDAAAVAHHYDVSNEFYEHVLGPSMTYSCAVWSAPDVGLEAAQAAKYDLVARKLDLHPGARLLDVGCGWGGMVRHAARHFGARAVGVTVSERQAEWAEKRVAEEGLADLVEIRLQDYRDVPDGPYDAISSIGMYEHVGEANLSTYFAHCRSLLRPGGRLLNHGITRARRTRASLGRRSFVGRYVFPDGELHEVGSVIGAMHGSGLEVRHAENLREHYALTLRAWVRNLEHRWQECVAAASPGRARVWRLYMAGSARAFERGDIQVHQVLAVRADGGRSGMPWRPTWGA
jgi:cyclopropane-fatty-acyl-phospholipid synthase